MNAFRKSVLLRGFAWLGICLGTLWWPTLGWANPTGGQVILGNAKISTLDSNKLLIEQLTDRALIQWENFSIDQGQITRFAQPGSNSVALNRVVGANPSMLNGLLQGNGNVWLMNSNGVFVGANGMVDVGGFMASTLDMSNEDFARGGSFRLSGDSTASVRNLGTIRAASGDVYLVAHQVENAGAIGALHGTVAMAGGNEVLINPGGARGEKVFVSGGDGSVVNSGQITSAYAELKAHGNVHAIAVQNSGSIRATGADVTGGRVVLRASGGGGVVSTGVVDAVGNAAAPGSVVMDAGAGEVRIGGLVQARNESGAGGSIDLVGNSVTVDSGAEVNAGGMTQGGSVDVRAGEIVIYGNSTLSANGAAGGDVRLQATGGVLVGGRVAAQGTEGAGGSVVATGQSVVLNEGSEMNASGATGGEVRVGGGITGRDDSIPNAQAVIVDEGAKLVANGSNGDGGSVVVFADKSTRFFGQIDARATGVVGNGGFAEVSGKRSLQIGGSVDTSSVNGRDGTFLIDPADVYIGASGANAATITGADLSTLLGLNNVIIYTDTAMAGNGNITVSDPVQWASDNSLALLAYNNINVYNHVRNAGGTWDPSSPLGVDQKSGTGNIYLVAGWNGTAGLLGADGQAAVDVGHGVIGDAADTLPGAGAMSQANYFDNFFGIDDAGTTYGVSERGTITIEAGLNSTNNGVVVGSRYGTTGLAADEVNIVGNPSGNGFAMVGFRDNGRIGNLSWVDTDANNAVDPGELTTDEDNYWWANINPGSALPGQGLALGGQWGARTGDRDVITDVLTGQDAVFFELGAGTLSGGRVLTGDLGVVGEAASRLQPEWVALQAYNHTIGRTDANYGANASAIRGDIAVRAGDNVQLVAGINESFAQIGHVGANGSDNIRTVHNGDGSSLFRADRDDDGQPGTAADANSGNRSGAPEVDGAHVFGSNILISAGLTGNKNGYVMLHANQGTNQLGYTLVGHGGARTAGVREGNIAVDGPGGVFLFGGTGNESFTAIGNVTSGGIHTGRSHQYIGDVMVDSRGQVQLLARQFGLLETTNTARAFVQVGHGGMISASNDTLNAGDANTIRLGRHRNLMLGTNLLSGAVHVHGNRGVTLEAGNRQYDSVQIGHNATAWGNDAIDIIGGGRGGSNAGTPVTVLPVLDPILDPNNAGNYINRDGFWHVDQSTGAISGYSPSLVDPYNAYTPDMQLTGSVKISHGKVSSFSGMESGVEVISDAGMVRVLAGVPGRMTGTPAGAADSVRLAYAMIGSGGFDGRIGFENASGGVENGDIRVDAYQDVVVKGGSHQYDFAQIGNGGIQTTSARNNVDEGTLAGNISVRSRQGNVLIRGGDAVGFAPLGNLPAVPIREQMYAMVGHGGMNAQFGRIDGDIEVMADNGNITLQGGAGDFAYAMVGSGGPGSNDGVTNQAGANRGFDGKVTVIAGKDVFVLGGAEVALDKGIDPSTVNPQLSPTSALYHSTWRFGRDNTNGTEVFLNYAQIGHGGPNTMAQIGAEEDPNIQIFGRNVTVRGGEGMLSYAQVGHGGSTSVNLGFDMNLDRTGNANLPTGVSDGNIGSVAADALDVGYLFLIRPGEQITAGPDGILGTLDDGVNDGYAEANAANVRFFALQPGTAGNFTFNFTYGNGVQLSTAVANWNAANPTRQIGFVGADQNPATTNLSVTLSGGVNNRYGADGVPGTADDLKVTTRLTGSFDDGNQQARQVPTDGRNGNISIYTTGDLTVEGGNRSNANANIAESFAYAQVGHGGPGSQGPTTGDIDVTVGGNLRVQGNYAGDGVSDISMDASKFLNLGTPDTANLNVFLRSHSVWGSNNAVTLNFDGTKTLQAVIDEYNNSIPDTTLAGVSTQAGDRRIGTTSTAGLVPGMTVYTDPDNPNANSIPQGSTILWIYDNNTFLIDQTPTRNASNQQVVFERSFDFLEIGDANNNVTTANAGTLVFKAGNSLSVAAGAYRTYGQTTIQTDLGPVTIAALNPGDEGNVTFQVRPGEWLSDAVADWNARNGAGEQVWITSQNGVGVVLSPTDATTIRLTGGSDGTLANGNRTVAWLAAKAIPTDPAVANPVRTQLDFSATASLSAAINAWNANLGTANVNRRVGYTGIDFVPPPAATTVASGGAEGSRTFVVANATGIPIGAAVRGANIPANTFVTAVNTTTRTITINNRIATGTSLTANQAINFDTLLLEDLQFQYTNQNGLVRLAGGVVPAIDWNVRGTQTSPAPYGYINFAYGSTAPKSLGINTTKGDAYAKIGHGEDVRNLIREPGMFLNNDFSYVPSTGNISVSVGKNATFLAGSVGHLNSQEGSTYTRYVKGETYLAVSRLDADATGSGVLTAAAQGGYNTVFSSGRDGVESQLRLYAPTEVAMDLDKTTRLNGEYFLADAVFGRADSQVESEDEATYGVTAQNGYVVAGAPVNAFRPSGALGTYQLDHGIGGVGRYTLFFGGIAPPQPIPEPFHYEPGEARDLAEDEMTDQIDRWERIDERSSDNRTFSFLNYWLNGMEWRTDQFGVSFLGGAGGGNALVLDENGQLVPMPINLDPNAGAQEVSLENATGGENVPTPPSLPEDEKKNGKGSANAGDVSTQGSGVNTDAPPADAMGGGAGDMGMGGFGEEAPKPNTEAAKPAAKTDPFAF